MTCGWLGLGACLVVGGLTVVTVVAVTPAADEDGDEEAAVVLTITAVLLGLPSGWDAVWRLRPRRLWPVNP